MKVGAHCFVLPEIVVHMPLFDLLGVSSFSNRCLGVPSSNVSIRTLKQTCFDRLYLWS